MLAFFENKFNFCYFKALGNLVKDLERLQISITTLVRTSTSSYRNVPGNMSMPATFQVSVSTKFLSA